jgi:hypothetical protein
MMQVHVVPNYADMTTDIYVVERDKYYTHTAKGIVEHAREDNRMVKPFMTLDSRFADIMIPLLLAQLNNSGWKLPEKSYLEGKVEILEKQVADLRNLVPLPRGNTLGTRS